MRLEELYLDGFGRFHEQTIGPLSQHITVIYGPNEAGKSTLLAFIRALLFGFPAAAAQRILSTSLRWEAWWPNPVFRRCR